jgi:hypothetical protein
MISGALNLHTLKLDVHWIPYLSHTIKLSGRLPPPEASPTHPQYLGTTFTLQNATDLMLTLENPKLRVIGIGRRQFIVRLHFAFVLTPAFISYAHFTGEVGSSGGREQERCPKI